MGTTKGVGNWNNKEKHTLDWMQSHWIQFFKWEGSWYTCFVVVTHCRRNYRRYRWPGEGPLCCRRTLLPVERSAGVWAPWAAYSWLPGAGSGPLLLVEFQHWSATSGVKITMMQKSEVDFRCCWGFPWASRRHLASLLHEQSPANQGCLSRRTTSCPLPLWRTPGLSHGSVERTLTQLYNGLAYRSCHDIHIFRNKTVILSFVSQW